jgi:hypothetical protein
MNYRAFSKIYEMSAKRETAIFIDVSLVREHVWIEQRTETVVLQFCLFAYLLPQ